MSFKDFKINISYKSVGEESISDIINPLLEQTRIYKRSVGFFSSSAFAAIIDGVIGLVRNGGEIQLIASPKLTKEDIEAKGIRQANANTYLGAVKQQIELNGITIKEAKADIDNIIKFEIVGAKNE